MSIERDLEDVLETLSNLKRRGKACSLLIGAGCSVSAGIPTAGEFVDVIEERYPRAFGRAKEKTYPATMAELASGERWAGGVHEVPG